MPAPALLRRPGRPSVVTEPEEIDELAAWIVDEQRDRPLVVLTAREGDEAPYFPVASVQRLVGTVGDVVAIAQYPGGRLTRALARALPDGMMVFGGAARIYWPPADVGLDPDCHPLVRADPGAGPSAAKRDRLADRWRRGPDDRDPYAGTADGLPVAIVRAWVALIPDDELRERFPLRAYRVAPALAEQLEVLEPARAPVAAAAAQILSGHAWTQPGPIPRRVEQGGRPIVRDSDSAVAWSYPLADSDQPLAYWQPADGPITLARIGAHDTPPALPPKTPAPAKADPPAAPVAEIAAGSPPARRPAERASPTPKAAGAPALKVTDEQLLRVLRDAGEPLLAPEIRAALNIDPGTDRRVVSALLGDAVERGVIQRTGQRRGTRYAAP
ncbi:unannotated protein [freshwater metagenome]|uniref:Unannotated protein n=1 Tax=freshwater metagenome TaxID=449393 RepID=A0A6J7J9P9_9ZZZZ|nr:hypothetical protein [Actinomycetota bacterium]